MFGINEYVLGKRMWIYIQQNVLILSWKILYVNVNDCNKMFGIWKKEKENKCIRHILLKK
jgi:hypothetical protein